MKQQKPDVQNICQSGLSEKRVQVGAISPSQSECDFAYYYYTLQAKHECRQCSFFKNIYQNKYKLQTRKNG